MKTGCFANVELIWLLILGKLNQSPSIQMTIFLQKKMEYECDCLLHHLPKCTWGLHTKSLVVHSFFKLSIWNVAHTLPSCGHYRNYNQSDAIIVTFLLHFKDGGKKTMVSFFVFSSTRSIVLYSPYIQFTFPQTPKCLLSNGTNNMYIFASGPELQAVRFGYVI